MTIVGISGSWPGASPSACWRKTEAAKSAGKEALPLLEAALRERPDDTFAMTELSWVYLALGRNADALRLSRQAADIISIEKEGLTGPSFQIGLAQIEARAGAPEEAIKRLRHLLSIPAGDVASIALLKIDPVWDPFRTGRISSSCSQARSRSDLTSNRINLRNFFAELNRRNVYKVTIAYGVVVWLLMQVATLHGSWKPPACSCARSHCPFRHKLEPQHYVTG